MNFYTLFMTLMFLLFSVNSNASCPTLKNDKIKCNCHKPDLYYKNFGHIGIKIDQKYNAGKASCFVCKKDCGNTLSKAVKLCKNYCRDKNKEEGTKNYISRFTLEYKQGRGAAKWHKSSGNI